MLHHHPIKKFEFRCLSLSPPRQVPRAAAAAGSRTSAGGTSPPPPGPCGRGTARRRPRRASGHSKRGDRPRRSSDLSVLRTPQMDRRQTDRQTADPSCKSPKATLEKESLERACLASHFPLMNRGFLQTGGWIVVGFHPRRSRCCPCCLRI